MSLFLIVNKTKIGLQLQIYFNDLSVVKLTDCKIDFVLYCPLYDLIRQELLCKVDPNNKCMWLDDAEKLKHLFELKIFTFS